MVQVEVQVQAPVPTDPQVEKKVRQKRIREGLTNTKITWATHVIPVSAQVLLVLTLALWTLDLGFTILLNIIPKVSCTFELWTLDLGLTIQLNIITKS